MEGGPTLVLIAPPCQDVSHLVLNVSLAVHCFL